MFVAIARACQPHQTEARIVDDKLRLGALRRQLLTNQPRGPGLQQISRNDNWPACAGRRNFVGQRMQSVFPPGDESQFMTVLREYARQRDADPGRGSGDYGDWPQTAHSCCLSS